MHGCMGTVVIKGTLSQCSSISIRSSIRGGGRSIGSSSLRPGSVAGKPQQRQSVRMLQRETGNTSPRLLEYKY